MEDIQEKYNHHMWILFYNIYNQVLCFRTSFRTFRFCFRTSFRTKYICFRTDSGADDFAKLHSIAETAVKNGNSMRLNLHVTNAILVAVQP